MDNLIGMSNYQNMNGDITYCICTLNYKMFVYASDQIDIDIS